MLAFSNSLMNSYIAGVLLGTGIVTTVSRLFIKMISLPMHCERGTGNNTYQLMWEVGMLSGFLFENMWTESHPDTCLLYTSSKRVMGKYANSRWSSFVLYTIAVIVSALNIMLLLS